jgi:hypothetical protein
MLGRAAPPRPPSAFFSRDVLRRIRQQPTGFQWRDWISLRRLIPATVALALVAASAVFLEHQFVGPRPTEGTPEVVAKIDPQDFEVVADLDVLLASDETNLWDDDQSL